MMKIGEFSKLSMLTIKALRFYAKLTHYQINKLSYQKTRLECYN